MMADAAGVFIKIGASSKELVSEVGKAGKSLKGLDGEGKKLGKSLKILGKGFVGVGVAAAGAGVAIAALTVDAANNAKEMIILADAAGVGTEEFQRLAFAAKSVGIEQDQLSDILKDTNDRLGDFITSGAGEMKDFFEIIAPKVGVTVEMFKKLNSREALGLYVDSLEKANLSQAQMTFFMEGIASESTKLLPLLKNNGKAMRELGREADSLGAVLSDTDIEDLAKAAEEIGKLKAAFSALGAELAVQFAPALSELASSVLDFFKEGRLKETITENSEVIDAHKVKLREMRDAVDLLKNSHDPLAAAQKNIIAQQKFGLTMLKKGSEEYKRLSSSINVASESLGKTENYEKQEEAIKKQVELINKLVLENNALREGTTALNDSKEDEVKLTDAQVRANAEELAALKALAKAKEESAKTDQDVFDAKLNRWQVEAEAQAFRIQDLNAFLMTEQEVKQANYEQDLADLQAAKGTELESIRGFNEDKKRLDAEYAESKAVIDQVTYRDTLNAASGMFGDLSTLMDRENKAGFEVGKAAAIANAGIKSALAAINSFEAGSKLPGGPVTGAAFAAASLAATLPMISDLAGMSYGGGGGGGSAPSVAAPQVQQQSTSIDVSLTGNNFNKQGVEDLFDQINSGLDDGMTISGINLV